VLSPVKYFINSAADTFLVIVPAIQWCWKPYSYFIVTFRALIRGFAAGAGRGFETSYGVARYPWELVFLAITVESVQAMVVSAICLALAEAMQLSRACAVADEECLRFDLGPGRLWPATCQAVPP